MNDQQPDSTMTAEHKSLRDERDVSGLTLTDHKLMEILGLKKSAFYKNKKAGAYRFLEVRPQITGHTLYSGALVQNWRNGAGTAPVFGQRRYRVAR